MDRFLATYFPCNYFDPESNYEDSIFYKTWNKSEEDVTSLKMVINWIILLKYNHKNKENCIFETMLLHNWLFSILSTISLSYNFYKLSDIPEVMSYTGKILNAFPEQ